MRHRQNPSVWNKFWLFAHKVIKNKRLILEYMLIH
jgi:hypothetical protein